ncbi:uncharacterized protein N7443_007796 [Penicillium atrosanguineum]|uniref:uncharacterized protein n=1 Tax=Penicillium atrosanguineum TaxID=1132637 RepID=UPI00238A455A|nr:uncharacterized protein N7443_007796 [Penicillium atrosanguineum]KAJ5296903.1 hypothetical protein N7443_007796 [Penicillium atrosanguineum]
MPTHLSVLITVASPLDYARYRHASLYLEFENGERLKSALMEVVGSPGFFSFFERANIELPVSSTNIARVIRISSLPDTVPVSSLQRTIAETPIMNDADWNSQNWVGDALARLVMARYLDEEAERRGLDEMVDAIMEASDEKC